MANNRYIMFEKQTFATETFPTLNAAALAHAVDQVSEDISIDHGFVNPVTSAKRSARSRLYGPIIGGGDIGIPMYTLGFSTLAYYALGKNVTVVGDGINGAEIGGFIHTITPGNTIPSFVMEVGKDLKKHEFIGCAMKSMKLDYTIDNPALSTFDVLVRKELAPGTVSTPTFPDYDEAERTFLGTEVVAEIDDSVVGYIRSASIEINNTLVEDNHGFGSRYLPDLIVQDLEVKGSMTMSYTDIARYTDVLDESTQKLELIFTQNSVSSLTHRQLKVELPKVSLDVGKLPTDGNKEYIVNIDFTAQAVNNDDELIKMVIINEESEANHII